MTALYNQGQAPDRRRVWGDWRGFIFDQAGEKWDGTCTWLWVCVWQRCDENVHCVLTCGLYGHVFTDNNQYVLLCVCEYACVCACVYVFSYLLRTEYQKNYSTAKVWPCLKSGPFLWPQFQRTIWGFRRGLKVEGSYGVWVRHLVAMVRSRGITPIPPQMENSEGVCVCVWVVIETSGGIQT